MGARDYASEPETPRDKAIARRAALRMKGGGAVFEALRAKNQPNEKFYDAAAILAFEASHPKPGGMKEQLIRQTFNASATRYQQRLYHLIHDDEAHARTVDATTVTRLLALEAERGSRRNYLPEGYTS